MCCVVVSFSLCLCCVVAGASGRSCCLCWVGLPAVVVLSGGVVLRAGRFVGVGCCVLLAAGGCCSSSGCVAVASAGGVACCVGAGSSLGVVAFPVGFVGWFAGWCFACALVAVFGGFGASAAGVGRLRLLVGFLGRAPFSGLVFFLCVIENFRGVRILERKKKTRVTTIQGKKSPRDPVAHSDDKKNFFGSPTRRPTKKVEEGPAFRWSADVFFLVAPRDEKPPENFPPEGSSNRRTKKLPALRKRRKKVDDRGEGAAWDEITRHGNDNLQSE